ncbi:MAG: EamA family transporter [Patescibacteria group bacterium]
MSSWVLYSLLGTAIYVIVVFIDKYVLSELIKDYRGMAMYSAIVGLVAGTFLWIITGFPILELKDGFLVILTGILSIFSAAIYFYVVQREHGSKVIFLFQLIPVFVLILAIIFLKEILTFQKFLGFILILIPSLLISSSEEGKLKLKLNIDTNTVLLLISDFLIAVSAVLFKFVVDAGSFSKVVAYESWGWAIGGVVLFTFIPSVRKAFISTVRNLKKTALVLIFGNEIIYLTSKLLLFLAISLGPVYLVNVITGTQVLFGAIYGVILTMIAPNIFKEDVSKSGLFKKLVLGAVTLVGLALIY